MFGRKRAKRQLSYEEARQILVDEDAQLGKILKRTTLPKREQMSLFQSVGAKMRSVLNTIL